MKTISDISFDKAAVRKAVFARRKAAHATAVPVVSKPLVQAIRPKSGLIVAGYMPIRTEIDPRPTMKALEAMGCQLALPVIVAAGQPLIFRTWSVDAPLIEGAFGAAIPAGGETVDPDALIVPLVGFDKQRNRLGYGGGFYDRTLEQLRAQKRVHAVGFAYSCQEEAALTPEPTDQPFDLLVTPNRIFA